MVRQHPVGQAGTLEKMLAAVSTKDVHTWIAKTANILVGTVSETGAGPLRLRLVRTPLLAQTASWIRESDQCPDRVGRGCTHI